MLVKAEAKFAEAQYEDASDLCLQIVAKTPAHATANFWLGRIYYETGQIGRALYHYNNIPEKSRKSIDDLMLHLALAALSDGRYEEAQSHIDQYFENENFKGQQSPKYQRAQLVAQSVAFSIQQKSNLPSNKIEFRFMPPPVSTMESECAICQEHSGNKFVVTVKNSSGSNNIKFIHETTWKNQYEYDEFEYLNSKTFDGACTFNYEGNAFYFTRCESEDDGCMIYESSLTNGIWTRPEPLPRSINQPGSNARDPYLNGDTLIFSSDRNGGTGGYDIWLSTRDNDTWTEPVNIGNPVNTVFDERSPYFHAQDQILYFSSNGHPGLGKMDVFACNMVSHEIFNLGKPFNSGYNDVSFSTHNNKGYLASNRPGGMEGFDIYEFSIPHSEQYKAAAWDNDAMNKLYGALFAAELYGIPSKLMPSDDRTFGNLTQADKDFIMEKVKRDVANLTSNEIETIFREDDIIYASLKNEEREIVDNIVQAYTSDAQALDMYRRYAGQYDALDLQQKRKIDRVVASRIRLEMASQINELNQIQKLNSSTAMDAHRSEKANDPLPASLEKVPVKKPVTPVEQIERKDAVATASSLAAEKKPIAARENTPAKNKDEQFAELLGIRHSVAYYRNLPFHERKRIDRIMAIRLVNEQYTINPALRISDQQYYHALPAQEKAAINRLKLYFQSWNEAQQRNNIDTRDLAYLDQLPNDKKERIARIIVRRGIGVDVDNFVRFSGSDWENYKRYSTDDIENIKRIAKVLKTKNQVFNIALANADNETVYAANDVVQAAQFDEDPYKPASIPLKYESLFFNPGSAQLRKEAVVILNDLISIYQNNPSLTFQLNAISADQQTNEANRQLSERRIESVRRYLGGLGVPDEKISSRAFAEVQIDDVWSKDHLTHRRVDVYAEGENGHISSPYTTYMIQPGNTLYKIAQANNITVEELMQLNGLDDTKILAHYPMRVRKDADLEKKYVIESSSGLYYQDVTVKEVEDNDDASIPEDVKKDIERGGEIYSVQVKQNDPGPKPIIHVVRDGDKLKSIAKHYDVSIDHIMEFNELDKKRLKEGQRLVIRP